MSAGFPELDDLYGPSRSPAASVHAPAWPVHAAGVAALASALALVPAAQGEVLWGVLGYVLGGLATPVLTVVHRMLRRAARKNRYYVPLRRLERLLAVATALGIVLGVAHAWFLATELAKQ